MQVSVQSGEGLERRMTVELPADEINQEVEKIYTFADDGIELDCASQDQVARLRSSDDRFGERVLGTALQ